MSLVNSFNEVLPKKPYCTDDFEDGLKIRSKKYAIKKKYIQHNQPSMAYWIVLDIDRPFDFSTEFGLFPPPNLQIQNPINKHCHLLFRLETPVCTSELAKWKPLNFLANVEYSLKLKFQSDMAYANLITKNPNFLNWDVKEIRQEFWDLNEFSGWFDIENRPKNKDLKKEQGFGRNCTIFDVVRKWAYKNFRDYPNQRIFAKAVKAQCVSLNMEFAEPLYYKEVNAISKSIAKFCFTTLTKTSQAEYVKSTHTSKIQADRSVKGNMVKGNKAKERKAAVIADFEAGMTREELMVKYKIKSRQTIINYLKSLTC